MEPETAKPSENQQEATSSKALLQSLHEQLSSSNASIRRQAAFHLSWLQEDGLEILKSTLLGNYSKASKNAAAYGLRKMRGRMKKMAMEVINEGLRHQDRDTRGVCSQALAMLQDAKPRAAAGAAGPTATPRVPIKEIRAKRGERPISRRPSPDATKRHRGGNSR
jgi:hypothetical protein